MVEQILNPSIVKVVEEVCSVVSRKLVKKVYGRKIVIVEDQQNMKFCQLLSNYIS